MRSKKLSATVYCENCATVRPAAGAVKHSSGTLGAYVICAACRMLDRRFKKYEKSGHRWYYTGDFTLAEFINHNENDQLVLDEIVPELKKLSIRKSFVYYGGAGGDDKFVRVK